jgi:hypothetical protein
MDFPSAQRVAARYLEFSEAQFPAGPAAVPSRPGGVCPIIIPVLRPRARRPRCTQSAVGFFIAKAIQVWEKGGEKGIASGVR